MSITMKSLIAAVQLSLDTLVGNNYNRQLYQIITITIKICSSEEQVIIQQQNNKQMCCVCELNLLLLHELCIHN